MSGSAPPGQIYPGQYALAPQAAALDDEPWANLSTIPIAIAAATLSSAVAAANSFNLYTEEICAQIPAQSQSAPSNQRARHQTLFIRWDQQDDLPAVVIPSAFDEDGWSPPVTAAARIPLPVFDTEELPVRTVFEEDGQPQLIPAQRVAQVQQADEELPIASVPALEESGWSSNFYAKTVVIQPWNVDDDLPALIAPVPGPATVGGSYPQRAQHAIRFVQLGQAEDLPTTPSALVSEESDWSVPFYKSVVIRAESVEEEFPTLSAPTALPMGYGGSYPQRAREPTRFLRWYQTEEFPTPVTPAVPDEVEGPNFPAKIREADGIMWATEEEIVPQPPVEEFYWQPYFTLQPTAKSAYLPDAEEFPAGNLFPLAAEEYHHFIPAKLFIPIAPVVEYDDVIVPQPVPLNVDEEYDIIPMVRVPVPQPVVVTFGGDEEMGDFVAPPEETRDRGAKWPVKITEYITKIKNRFYWFRDESELPKEEPAKTVVAKVEIEPVVTEKVKTELEVQSAAEVAKRKQIERMNEAIMKLFI